MSVNALALSVPARPTARVNDYAGVLGAERQVLEDQLAGYAAGTTTQYAVAIFPSLDGESVEDFTIRLAEAWKIGGKQQSDGVLVTVFMQEHKVRIDVGYGLEDRLTDAFCARVIRDTIGPAAARGQLGAGLSSAFAQIDKQATGRDHVPPLHAPPSTSTDDGGKLGGFVMTLILVILILWLSNRGRGGRGGGVGPFLGGWILGSSSGGSSWGGGGGSWGGGGGGFSGGGGSFGGGGATGGW